MNFQLDLNTVTNLLVVAAVSWGAKFARNVDVRLTRIETTLAIIRPKHKHAKENEEN